GNDVGRRNAEQIAENRSQALRDRVPRHARVAYHDWVYDRAVPATQVGPIEGCAIWGAGTAFPPHELTNAEVLRRVWPAGARDPERVVFAARGFTEATGIKRRTWEHRVGDPLDPANEMSSHDLSSAATPHAL